MTKDAREFATVRWVQRRFRPARGSAPEGTTMRNLMGQLDGTVNPVPGGAEFDAAFWTTGPGWFAGGTVLVLRRGKLDRLRGNGFGVLGLVQSIGDLGASLDRMTCRAWGPGLIRRVMVGVLVAVSRRESVPGHGDQHAKGCHDRMMPAV